MVWYVYFYKKYNYCLYSANTLKVSKIFVDNSFPVEVVRLKTVIRCVDISISKRKLATVDEEGTCVIYDIETKEILNQVKNL